MKRVTIKGSALFYTVAGFALLAATGMSLWTVLDPWVLQADLTVLEETNVKGETVLLSEQFCGSSNDYWMYGSLLVHYILLMWAIVLTCQVQGIPQSFHETRLLAAVVFVQCLFVVSRTVLIAFPDDGLSHFQRNCLSSLAAGLDSLFTLCIYFLPKLLFCTKDHAQELHIRSVLPDLPSSEVPHTSSSSDDNGSLGPRVKHKESSSLVQTGSTLVRADTEDQGTVTKFQEEASQSPSVAFPNPQYTRNITIIQEVPEEESSILAQKGDTEEERPRPVYPEEQASIEQEYDEKQLQDDDATLDASLFDDENDRIYRVELQTAENDEWQEAVNDSRRDTQKMKDRLGILELELMALRGHIKKPDSDDETKQTKEKEEVAQAVSPFNLFFGCAAAGNGTTA